MKHTLDPAPYWRLRAICTDAQRAAETAQHAHEVFVLAQHKQRAALTDLGFDPTAQAFTLDDDTLSVTFAEAPPAAVSVAPFQRE